MTGEKLTKHAKSRCIQVEQGWYNYIDGNESTRAFARLLTDSLLSLLYDLLPDCAELHRERTDCSTERLNFQFRRVVGRVAKVEKKPRVPAIN